MIVIQIGDDWYEFGEEPIRVFVSSDSQREESRRTGEIPKPNYDVTHLRIRETLGGEGGALFFDVSESEYPSSVDGWTLVHDRGEQLVGCYFHGKHMGGCILDEDCHWQDWEKKNIPPNVRKEAEELCRS